ncbi:hypothetical protein ACFLY3_04055 [Chloroflexota bacterium]
MIKRILRMIKNESGQALLLVIALLGVGGIMLAPLLGFMGTGLKAGQVYEVKVDEFYAADAGVEDAIWNIQNGGAELVVMAPDGWPVTTLEGLPPYIYDSGDPENPFQDNGSGTYYDIAPVNGNSVRIKIEHNAETGGTAYKVISTATGADGSDTEIEAWVTTTYGDYHNIMDNAITSPNDVGIAPGVNIVGDVQYNGDIDNKGDVDGEIYDDEILWWPTQPEISMYYWEDLHDNYDWDTEVTKYDVDTEINIPSGTTEEDPFVIGPMWVDGDLILKGSGYIKLGGTIFITGDFDSNPTPGINIQLDLQTIYSEGSIFFNPGITSTGSGCLVAVYDLTYQPQISGDDFVFLMSLQGVVTLQPGGDFYGSIAGDSEVNLQPGTSLIWTDPDDIDGNLNFPGGDDDPNNSDLDWGILSWKIS